MGNKSIMFKVPNRDTQFNRYTFCSKEVLQQCYRDSIGKIIDYCGELKKVVSVAITETEISVELEDIPKEIIID